MSFKYQSVGFIESPASCFFSTLKRIEKTQKKKKENFGNKFHFLHSPSPSSSSPIFRVPFPSSSFSLPSLPIHKGAFFFFSHFNFLLSVLLYSLCFSILHCVPLPAFHFLSDGAHSVLHFNLIVLKV